MAGSTRVPVVASLLILIAAAGIGWHDHRRLTAARAAHADLITRAAAAGMRVDPAGTGEMVRDPKLPRMDRESEARRVAAGFISYAKEMSARGDELRTPDEATRRRIAGELDRVMGLDGEQLRILIDEIGDSEDLDDNERMGLLTFALGRLRELDPQKSVELLLTLPSVLEQARLKNGYAENMMMSAFRSWSRGDARSAVDWFRSRKGEIPESLIVNSIWGLIQGCAVGDPDLAFQLVDEVGMDPEGTVPQIARAAETAEERLAVFGALRRWEGGGAADGPADEVLRLLAFGNSHEAEGFDAATAWIAKAGLDRNEIQGMADGIGLYVKPEECGRWMEWLVEALPEGGADASIRELMDRWARRDYRAAEAWLDRLDEGRVKELASEAYRDAADR